MGKRDKKRLKGSILGHLEGIQGNYSYFLKPKINLDAKFQIIKKKSLK